MNETRINELEGRVLELERELAELRTEPARPDSHTASRPEIPAARPQPRAAVAPQATAPSQTAATPPAPRPSCAPEPLPEREPLTLEDVLSPRNLAIAGAIAVLAGLVFLVSYGISNGWISEEVRVIGAATFAALLAGAGVFLREVKKLAAPAETLVVAGLAGLFISLVAATRLYDLIDPVVALVFSAMIGGVGLTIGLAWRNEMISTGVLFAALLAPLMVGASYDPGLLVFLVPVFAAGVAAAVLHPWPVIFPVTAILFLASLLISVADTEQSSTAAAFALSLLTICLVVTGAVGRPIRLNQAATDQQVVLFGLFFSIVTVIGTFLVTGSERPLIDCAAPESGCATNLTAPAALWLTVSAAIGGGVFWVASLRKQQALAVTAFALGSASLAAALGFLFQGGPLLTAAWSVEAACLIGLGVSQWQRLVGLTVLAAAIIGVLIEVPLSVLSESTETLWRDLAAVAPLLLPLGLLAWREKGELGGVGAGLATCFATYMGVIVCGYLTAPDNLLNLLPLCLAAVVPACLTNREWSWVTLTLFGLAAIGFTVGTAIPFDALVNGVPSATVAASAAAMLVASALALAFFGPVEWRQPALWSAAGFTMYAVSVMIVNGFQGGTDVHGELPVEAQGQVIVSSLWALTGLGLVVAGLLRARLTWRKGGLVLLVLALAKICLYDLASLSTAGRTISFIAVGLILLAAAFAYQWMNRRSSEAESEPLAP